MEFARRWRAEQGKGGVEGAPRRSLAAAHAGVRTHARGAAGVPSVPGPQVGRALEVMWAAMVVAIARQDDDLPEFHVITCPTLVIVGETDTPFRGPSKAMADCYPARRARRDPGRRSFTAVQGALCVDRRVAVVPRCARRDGELIVEAHGGRSRGRGPACWEHGVDVMFTLSGGHLFVLYDGAVQADLRLVDTRHEQTATFAAEGWAKATRRWGCAALYRRPGHHQRCQRDDRGRHERIADGRRRRSRAAALGQRLAARARPRADRRVGGEARRDGDVGGVDRRGVGRGVPGGADAAPRPRVRRHPARRLRSGGTSTSPQSIRLRSGAWRPIPRPCKPSRKARGRIGATGALRGRRRVLGPRRRRARRVRGGGPHPCVRQWNGTRARSQPTTSLVLLRSVIGRAEGSRPRARRRDTARLPTRVRPVRRRSGGPPGATPNWGWPSTPTLAASTAGDLLATFTLLADAGSVPGVDEDWIAKLRTDEQAKRGVEAQRRWTTIARPSVRRASTESCVRSGSTATRS